MLFVNGFVVVIMAEQPVVVFCSFFDLLLEVCEPICLVVTAPHEGDACGSAVGDDVIHLPVASLQILQGFAVSHQMEVPAATTRYD